MRLGAMPQTRGDPLQGHRCFSPKTTGHPEFGRVAFLRRVRSAPSKRRAQFFIDDARGLCLGGFVDFRAVVVWPGPRLRLAQAAPGEPFISKTPTPPNGLKVLIWLLMPAVSSRRSNSCRPAALSAGMPLRQTIDQFAPSRTSRRRLQKQTETAPAITPQRGLGRKKLRAHRIQMHVIAHRSQRAAFAPTEQRLVTASEQMSGELVATIETRGVKCRGTTSSGDQLGWGVSTTR